MTDTIKTRKSSSKQSLALSFYTLLSRLLGLVRDHFMAVSFGTGMVASAFSVAYRLPNMFRNLLAEGTLSQSFMPLFSEYEKRGIEEARLMSGTILSFLFVCLSLFVAFFSVFASKFLPYLVGGSKEYGELVVELSLVLFFLIQTASLSSIFMSISNSKQKYFVPSLSPIILNLSYITVFLLVFPFVSDLKERAFYLAYGIVFGGVSQLLVQAWYVYKSGYGPIFRFNFKHPSIKKIFNLMLPAALGGSFYQIGLLVDIFLANYIQNQNPGLGAVVSLDYSQRLVQLPTGIIGVALATTILPSLLRDLREGYKDNVKHEITEVIGFSFFLTLPASVGLLVLSEPILNALYFGGKWDQLATQTAILPLIFYGLAIPFYSVNKILVSSFYAFTDTKTPLKIQILAFATSIVLSVSLMVFFKHSAIALASAASASLTACSLFYFLRLHEVYVSFRVVFQKVILLLPALLWMAIWLLFSEIYVRDELAAFVRKFWVSGVASEARIFLLLAILPASLVYFGMAKFLRLPEADILFGRFFTKPAKTKSL